MTQLRRFRAGGWLYHDRGHIDVWICDLKARVVRSPRPLAQPIQEFKNMVESDPVLNFTVEAMFKEAALLKQQTPLGTPEVQDFDEFLTLLNGIMHQAPEYTECPNKAGKEEPCGLIGFPVNALLDWPMATSFGYDVGGYPRGDFHRSGQSQDRFDVRHPGRHGRSFLMPDHSDGRPACGERRPAGDVPLRRFHTLLVFGSEVKLDFDFHHTKPGLDADNIPVRSRIATVS